MFSEIKIDEQSNVPKYIQVTESIIRMVEEGKLKLGEKLPSINEAYHKLKISRDTLINAYEELRAMGIVAPQHGKGFYIANITATRHLNIFMLFDVMNGYKSILYKSLVEHLGQNCKLDIYFHHYNLQLFENLIRNSIGKYGYYIIMPHFNEDVSELINIIPADKLLLIDKDIPNQEINCAAVFQDFENDIYHALESGIDLIRKYNRIFMVTTSEFQFIPDGLISGFKKFAVNYKIENGFVEKISNRNIQDHEAYLVFTDNDLVDLIKLSQEKGLELGKSIGIISYDDTPLKEVLAGGITVISTDFRKMGETASNLILEHKQQRIINPCRLIKRKSL